MNTLEYLLELNQQALEVLLTLYKKPDYSKVKLIFPKDKTNNKDRISEQELRFVYSIIIERKGVFNPFHYSIETPTQKDYKFKGNSISRAAMSDMSLYLVENTPVKICNIECKAHNPEINSIKKDIEKLCLEKETGAWCHLLINQDSKTLNIIFDKIRDSLDTVLNKYKSGHDEIFSKEYFFSFITLEKKCLITRKILKNEITDYKRIFQLNYNDVKKLTNGEYTDNGWLINRF